MVVVEPPRSRQAPAAPRRAGVALGLALGLMLPLAGCGGGTTPTTYDLTAVRAGEGASAPRGARGGQLLVAEPITVQALDSERILVKGADGAISFLGGGQWADRLPRLMQARLIQSFENLGRRAAVGRPGDRLVGDYQLNTDIRAFQVQSASGEAFVEVSARLIQDRNGRVAAARIFSARVPVSAVEAGPAAAALDRALAQVLADIVRWAN